MLWKTDKLKDHTGYHLYLRDGYLFTHDTAGRVSFSQQGDIIYKFDPKTGTKLGTMITPIELGQPRFDFAIANIDFRRSDQWLLAIDAKTSNVLWSMPFTNSGNYVLNLLILVDDLVVMTLRTFGPGTLIVYEPTTSNVLWQTAGVITAPVVLNDIVYVMTVDGRIKAYELRSGSGIGVLIVNPQVTGHSNNGYNLTGDESRNLLFAYYGDSQELIAFKLIEE